MTNVAGRFALALHGGAGTLWRGEMTAEREAAYGVGLLRALSAGRAVLAAAGNAVTVTVCAGRRPPVQRRGWLRAGPSAGRHSGPRRQTMADRRLSPYRSRGIIDTQVPAFTNFARPTGIARAKRPHNSYNAIVLHVCHKQPAQKLMILNVPPLPGALLRVSSRGQGTTTPRLAICSETETRRKASASRIVFERWAFRKS